jgi:hypothetical protein
MKVHKNVGEASDTATLSTGLEQDGPQEVRILIVSENESIAERLGMALSEADFIWERVNSITAGCESARSGRFQVILTTPLLGDGSWRRLVDIAAHYDFGFVVILVATTLTSGNGPKLWSMGHLMSSMPCMNCRESPNSPNTRLGQLT